MKLSLPIDDLTTRSMNSHYRLLFSLPVNELPLDLPIAILTTRSSLPTVISLPDQWIVTTDRWSHYQIDEIVTTDGDVTTRSMKLSLPIAVHTTRSMISHWQINDFSLPSVVLTTKSMNSHYRACILPFKNLNFLFWRISELVDHFSVPVRIFPFLYFTIPVFYHSKPVFYHAKTLTSCFGEFRSWWTIFLCQWELFLGNWEFSSWYPSWWATNYLFLTPLWGNTELVEPPTLIFSPDLGNLELVSENHRVGGPPTRWWVRITELVGHQLGDSHSPTRDSHSLRPPTRWFSAWIHQLCVSHHQLGFLRAAN
jgi:hypothetical protein